MKKPKLKTYERCTAKNEKGQQCCAKGSRDRIATKEMLCEYHFLELRKAYREDKPGPEFYGVKKPKFL